MNLLTHLRIGRRLGLAFAICIAFSVVLAVYARSTLGRINADLDLMVNDRMVKVEKLGQFKNNVNTISMAARDIVLAADEAAIKREVEQIAELRRRNLDIIKSLDAIITIDKARVMLKEIGQAREAYAAATDRVIALRRAGDGEKARDLLVGEARQARERMTGALDTLIGFAGPAQLKRSAVCSLAGRGSNNARRSAPRS